MMIEMNNPVVPGQVCLTRARVVPNPNKGCLRNLVNVVGKGKLGGNIFISSPPQLVEAATTSPISIPIPIPIQRRRRLMATSNTNSDMANNNNIWPCIPSSSSSSYGDPCLDLFFDALRPEYRDANPCLKYLERLLPLAWSHDPLTTLKLIFTFDSILFSDRKFDTAVLWLHHNHPKTLLRNLYSIADLPFVPYPGRGSWYNLVQILYNVLVQKQDGQDHDAASHLHLHPERYYSDPDYRLLHDRVINVFVERLKSDMDKIEQSDYTTDSDDHAGLFESGAAGLLESGAAECCTSTRFWDKHRTSAIFLRHSIATRLSPPESEEDFLVPLTNYYKRRPEFANGVEKYLQRVKAAAGGGGNLRGGIGIIKPDALLPGEIIAYVKDEDVGLAAELQWKAMVDLYLKQQKKQGKGLGKFKNWLVVGRCPTKYFLEVGLGLLVSELSEEPWKGKLIGGGDEPEWIQGDHNFKSKCELMLKSDELSVLRVIDLILEVGVNAKLKADQMIKKLIVFTELEPPDTTTWEFQYELLRSEFEAIQSKYKDKGYGDDVVPHILYWHVSEGDFWICTQHPGFTLMSVGSDNLVKSFLHNGGEIGPHHFMEAVIAEKEYQTFVVVD